VIGGSDCFIRRVVLTRMVLSGSPGDVLTSSSSLDSTDVQAASSPSPSSSGSSSSGAVVRFEELNWGGLAGPGPRGGGVQVSAVVEPGHFAHGVLLGHRDGASPEGLAPLKG